MSEAWVAFARDAIPHQAELPDDIITQLSQIGGLKVISRTSVMCYKKSEKGARQIASELGVVHRGRERAAGGKSASNRSAVDRRRQRCSSLGRDVRPRTSFVIQSEVAGRVAEALRTRVSPARRLRLGRRPTRDLEAYNLYTLGRHQHSQGTPEALQREIDYYHRAIERDPMFARAYAALALLWMWQALGYFGIHPRDARVQAELYG